MQVDRKSIRKKITEKCRVLKIPTNSADVRRSIAEALNVVWSSDDVKRARQTMNAELSNAELITNLYVSDAIRRIRSIPI